jgi:hypothetical protein
LFDILLEEPERELHEEVDESTLLPFLSVSASYRF